MNTSPLQRPRLWNLPKESVAPLYLQIQDLILSHIEAGRAKPGDLLPSYPWLSRTLQVADKTVRQAYAELERLGVVEIHRGRGTFVTRGSAESAADLPRTGVIGLLPPGLPVDLSEETFFWRAMRAVQEAAWAERLDTLVLARAGDLRAPGAAEKIADRRRLDGVALLGSAVEEFVRRLHALRFPAVLVDVQLESVPVDGVVFDNAGAARDLTYKLIGLGHRKIGFAGIPRGQSSPEREAGYRHAMGAASLPVRPEWIARVDVDLGETGHSALDLLLGQGLTALVCFNGALALTAAEVAARRGLRVPEDLSLAATTAEGLWSLPGGRALERMSFDPKALGASALRLLNERIADPGREVRREVLAAVAVQGESVAGQ
ncbi:MAG: GntR family transcriptional regulator [Planctomycetota bacterium]|nr:GntR family transcriptional regulator [Planctomycetota bacterium]